jgi:hypothetical protein
MNDSRSTSLSDDSGRSLKSVTRHEAIAAGAASRIETADKAAGQYDRRPGGLDIFFTMTLPLSLLHRLFGRSHRRRFQFNVLYNETL